jgi:hypothetical protein
MMSLLDPSLDAAFSAVHGTEDAGLVSLDYRRRETFVVDASLTRNSV